MSKYASQAEYWKAQAIAIVERHRQHVVLSPGVGAEIQNYAIAVCDDILNDLRSEGAKCSCGPTDGCQVRGRA